MSIAKATDSTTILCEERKERVVPPIIPPATSLLTNTVNLNSCPPGYSWPSMLEREGYTVTAEAALILGIPLEEKSGFSQSETTLVSVRLVDLLHINGAEKVSGTASMTTISDSAAKCGFLMPPRDAAALARMAISDDDMRQLGCIWIAVPHVPVRIGERSYVLALHRYDNRRRHHLHVLEVPIMIPCVGVVLWDRFGNASTE